MLFSVIIPTYNREQCLREAIESVRRQTFTDYELIIVDDGSTDETPAFLATLGDSVRIVMQSNLGPGAARNAGAVVAGGDYLTFLDSDDVWFPWTLASHAESLQQTGATMSSGTGIFFHDSPPAHPSPAPLQLRTYDSFLHACIGDSFPCGGTPSIAVRRTIFQQVGGFAPGRINAEDTDLWLRLGAEPGYVRIESPPLFAQRLHPGSASTNIDRTLAGLQRLLDRETSGSYPGDAEFMWRRRALLAATARSTSIWALKAAHRQAGWSLYLRTLAWQLRLGRLRYLAGFPLMALASMFSPASKAASSFS